jgi:hypothetical protein
LVRDARQNLHREITANHQQYSMNANADRLVPGTASSICAASSFFGHVMRCASG